MTRVKVERPKLEAIAPYCWRVASASEAHRFHLIVLLPDGSFICSCKGFQNTGHCWHCNADDKWTHEERCGVYSSEPCTCEFRGGDK